MSLRPYLDAAILGVVQGLTEFLPISSKGHLVVFGQWLKRISPTAADDGTTGLAMIIALHMGTLLALAVFYRRDLWNIWQRPRLVAFIVVATIPACVVGLVFKKYFVQIFEMPLAVACGWTVTAVMLWLGQRFERCLRNVDEMRGTDALVVGLFQALALMPGISRSGSTITGGLTAGLKRDAAATFSFLIAMPVTAGAALLESRPLWVGLIIPSAASELDPVDWSHAGPMIFGAVVSFFVGIAVLHWFLRVIVKRGLNWFAYYCLAAAAFTFAIELTK